MRLVPVEPGIVALMASNMSQWVRATPIHLHPCCLCRKGQPGEEPMTDGWLNLYALQNDFSPGDVLCDECFLEWAQL